MLHAKVAQNLTVTRRGFSVPLPASICTGMAGGGKKKKCRSKESLTKAPSTVPS